MLKKQKFQKVGVTGLPWKQNYRTARSKQKHSVWFSSVVRELVHSPFKTGTGNDSLVLATSETDSKSKTAGMPTQ